MRRWVWVLWLVLGAGGAATRATPAPAAAPVPAILFEHVNVLPMDRARLLEVSRCSSKETPFERSAHILTRLAVLW